VLARRVNRKDNHIKKFFSKAFYSILSYLTDTKMDPSIGSFRIMSRKVVMQLRGMHEQTRFFGGLVNWLGFRTAHVDVDHAPRAHGETSYTLSKLLRLAVGAILAFSDKPLRLTAQFGLTISFISFCYGIYTIISKLFNPSLQLGWTSIIVSIYFMGGLVIGVIGICGLYIGRIFEEVKKRPLYVIDEKLNAD
jgi:dolichol-phosphate mannosyltransferase